MYDTKYLQNHKLTLRARVCVNKAMYYLFTQETYLYGNKNLAIRLIYDQHIQLKYETLTNQISLIFSL